MISFSCFDVADSRQEVIHETRWAQLQKLSGSQKTNMRDVCGFRDSSLYVWQIASALAQVVGCEVESLRMGLSNGRRNGCNRNKVRRSLDARLNH